MARLVGSVSLKRIAAIGFQRSENERLKALRFQWIPRDGLWVFQPAANTIESQIRSLVAALGCSFDLADTRVVPPIPGELPNRPTPPSPPQIKNKHWALISCMPDGKPLNLGKLSLETYTPIGTIPWPPNPKDLMSLPSPVSCGLPPETPMRLCLPTLPELHDLGFTRDNFWGLLEAAADLDLTIMTVEGEVCGANTMRLLHRLPKAPSKAPSSPVDLTPNQGGRPPSARVKSPDVLRLYAEGQSVSTIANILGISPRSIRRILDLSKDSVPLAT
ncbi:MAG TPA: helix-turn-helix domain-containing protein [Geothrix sp.]